MNLKILADDKSFEFLLCDITVSENLTTLRDRIQEYLLKYEKYRHVSSFNFSMRNVPISSRQEKFLTLGRIAQKLHKDELVIYIIPIYADVSICKTAVADNRKKVDIESNTSPNASQSEATKSETEYQVYSNADIKSSEGLELKKRLYWNERISDLADEIKSKRMSKFEAYGIIDVEWTRKQTDLLRVMADEAVDILQEKNVDLTSTSRKSSSHEIDVERAYEKLEQADSKLKYSYKRIEELHKKSDSHEKTELIKLEEENFDKLYSDLKCQQANLQKSLKVFRERVSTDAIRDKGATPTSSRIVEEREMQSLVEGIKEDYIVEDIAQDESPDEEMQI